VKTGRQNKNTQTAETLGKDDHFRLESTSKRKSKRVEFKIARKEKTNISV